MIVLITHWVRDEDQNGIPYGAEKLRVSHGIDVDTDKAIIMSNEHPESLGAVFDPELMEWVIYA